MNYISVKFKPTDRKKYTYKITDSMEVSVGDLVVVPTDYNEIGYTLAEVTKILGELEDVPHFPTKYIAGTVDMKEHLAKIAEEKRIAELTEKLEVMANRVEKIHKYKMLAEYLPEAKDILDELTGLTAKGIE